MNKLIIIGNLTHDPEKRTVDTANGPQTVCNFDVATNRRVRDKDYTEYFRVSCWNKMAENAVRFLSRGSKVYVEGPVTARAYTANDGSLRASMEIQSNIIEYLSRPKQTDQKPDGQGREPLPPAPNADDGFMYIPPGMNEADLPFS